MDQLPEPGQLAEHVDDADVQDDSDWVDGDAQDDGDWVDMGGYRVLRLPAPEAEPAPEPPTSKRKRAKQPKPSGRPGSEKAPRAPKPARAEKAPRPSKAPRPAKPSKPVAPPRPRALGRDQVAVAALVTGLLGPLGVPFGLVARARIRRSGQRGDWFATAGIVLGSAWLAVAAVAVVAASLRGDGPPAAAPSPSAPLRALGAGDCVLAAELERAAPVDRVPCGQPHDGEVFAVFPIGGTTWPGSAVVLAKAESGCPKRLAGYVGEARADLFTTTWVLPDEPAWIDGQRTIGCLLAAADGKALDRSHRA